MDLPGVWAFPVREPRSFRLYVGTTNIEDAGIVASFGPFEVAPSEIHEIALPWGLVEASPVEGTLGEAAVPPAPTRPSDASADSEVIRGTIAFRAVDATTGTPVAGAVLHLESLDGGNAPFLMCERDGTPHFSKLEAGRYEGRLTADGYDAVDSIRFEVREGSETDLGRLELTPQPQHRGRLLDAAGNPVAGARVQVFDSDSNRWAYAAEVTTDSDGRFSFKEVLVPPLVVDVRESNGGVQSVCVESWSERAEIELRVSPTFVVLVRVVGTDLEHESVSLVARSTRCASMSQVQWPNEAAFFGSRGARAQQLGPPDSGALGFSLRLAAGDWEIAGSRRRGEVEPLTLAVTGTGLQEIQLDVR